MENYSKLTPEYDIIRGTIETKMLSSYIEKSRDYTYFDI